MGCPERRSGMPGSFSTVLAHMEPPSSRKQAKRVRLGPKRLLLGSPDVLERTFYGQNVPFLPVFDPFLALGGSIWAITVLDEQGIPLRCSGHPTSLCSEKKLSLTKLGRGILGIRAK